MLDKVDSYMDTKGEVRGGDQQRVRMHQKTRLHGRYPRKGCKSINASLEATEATASGADSSRVGVLDAGLVPPAGRCCE